MYVALSNVCCQNNFRVNLSGGSQILYMLLQSIHLHDSVHSYRMCYPGHLEVVLHDVSNIGDISRNDN